MIPHDKALFEAKRNGVVEGAVLEQAVDDEPDLVRAMARVKVYAALVFSPAATATITYQLVQQFAPQSPHKLVEDRTLTAG